MIINANRKELLAQARRAAKAVPAKDTGQILRGLHLEADDRAGVLKLTATNTEAAIRVTLPVSVERGGVAVVDSELFIGILAKLPGEDAYMALHNNGQFLLSSEQAQFTVVSLPAKDYPKIDIPMPGETVCVTGLKTLTAATVFAAMKEPQKPAFGCVKLTLSDDGLQAAASNGYVLAVAEGDRDCKGDFSMLIPAQSLKTLASLSKDADVYELGVTGPGPKGKQAVFFDGTLLFAARLVEGDFLDADALLNSFKPAATVTIDAAQLRDKLLNVAAVAAAGDQIELSLGKNGLTLKCEAEGGSAIAVLETRERDSVHKNVFLSQSLLCDCVKTLRGDVALLFSGEGNLLIRAGGTQCLLVGQRKRQKKEQQSKKKAA